MDFKDLNDYTPTQKPLPSESVSIDGLILDEEIQGFQTLAVSGRETISLNIRTSGSLPGRDGEIYFDSDLPSRPLAIKYRLKAQTPREFIEFYDKLKELLFSSRKLRTIGFEDEDYVYFGYPLALEPIREGMLEVVSWINIVCLDPYKYSELKTLTGISSILINTNEPSYDFPKKISTLKLKPSTSIDTMTIRNVNRSQIIIIQGPFAIGDEVIVDFDKTQIFKGNENITSALDYAVSDFPDFILMEGDEITTSQVSDVLYSSVEIKYRSRCL